MIVWNEDWLNEIVMELDNFYVYLGSVCEEDEVNDLIEWIFKDLGLVDVFFYNVVCGIWGIF